METTFHYKNLTKQEEQVFFDYASTKLPAIEKMLTKFADDASLLKITVERFDKHVAYCTEFCLTLPTKSLVATETSHTITKAVDLSRDRLMIQLKKHLGQLRRERPHKSLRTHAVHVPEAIRIHN